MGKRIVLVDMDEVLVRTYENFLKKLQEVYPEIEQVPYERATKFCIKEDYPEPLREKVDSIWRYEGLFVNFPIMPGALEALIELKKNNEVFICSSPISSPYCSQEKVEWTRRNLGIDWVRRLILTKDKTLVYGDILIEDKPKIKGCRIPFWEQVIYDHPWNRHITGKRRINWQNWKEVLHELLKEN